MGSVHNKSRPEIELEHYMYVFMYVSKDFIQGLIHTLWRCCNTSQWKLTG